MNPVLVPILGRVVFDSLRRRCPLVLLLQNKLGHPMMPSLGLSFSPFPAGNMVSRESQKTRKFRMEGGVLLGFRVSNKLTDEINFRCFQESSGKFDRAYGKRTARLVSHQKFSSIGRLDRKISAFQVGAFLAIDLMV